MRPELWIALNKQFCLQPSLECQQRWLRSDIGRQTVLPHRTVFGCGRAGIYRMEIISNKTCPTLFTLVIFKNFVSHGSQGFVRQSCKFIPVSIVNRQVRTFQLSIELFQDRRSKRRDDEALVRWRAQSCSHDSRVCRVHRTLLSLERRPEQTKTVWMRDRAYQKFHTEICCHPLSSAIGTGYSMSKSDTESEINKVHARIGEIDNYMKNINILWKLSMVIYSYNTQRI